MIGNDKTGVWFDLRQDAVGFFEYHTNGDFVFYLATQPVIPHKPETSKTVLFECPQCAYEFVVDRAFHGRQAICRGCGESVLVNLNEREEASETETPTPMTSSLRETPAPVSYTTPATLRKGTRCQWCAGRVIHGFVLRSEIWWADEKGRPLSPLANYDSVSPLERCISCGFAVLQPADWLPPHDEAGWKHAPSLESSCDSCGGFRETGLLTSSAGRPASILFAQHADAIDAFRINAGYAHVPISATHCRQCGRVGFIARKWMNEEGMGGANLLGERPI